MLKWDSSDEMAHLFGEFIGRKKQKLNMSAPQATLISEDMEAVERSISCAFSPHAGSLPAYSLLEISGKLILSRKVFTLTPFLSLLYLCEYNY